MEFCTSAHPPTSGSIDVLKFWRQHWQWHCQATIEELIIFTLACRAISTSAEFSGLRSYIFSTVKRVFFSKRKHDELKNTFIQTMLNLTPETPVFAYNCIGDRQEALLLQRNRATALVTIEILQQ